MIKKSRFYVSLPALLSVILLAGQVSLAQTQKINWTRMQRDLDIMEGILDELLAPSKHPSGFSTSGARGLYFGGYGVVFQITLSGPLSFELTAIEKLSQAKELLEQTREQMIEGNPEPRADEFIVIDRGKGAVMKKDALSPAKRIKQLSRQCTEFLSDYADAIGQLQSNDRITLLINLEQFQPAVFRVDPMNRENIDSSPTGLAVTAKKSDIVDFRKGKLKSETFRSRIVFLQHFDNKQENRNIDIMANILNTALNRKYHQEFSSRSGHEGVYLDGLGALFFLRGELFNGKSTYVVIEKYIREQRTGIGVKNTRKEQPDEKIKESLADFKSELIELVGDYGHTLRRLKPTEYVVITVDFEPTWGPSLASPSQMILKVQKQDLDLYDRGELTLAQLRKKVAFQEY